MNARLPLLLTLALACGWTDTPAADAARTAKPPMKPHPDAVPNIHLPGAVDRPELVPFIVADPAMLAGIVVDDTAAVLRGSWQYSTHTPPYVGLGYLHDRRDGKGEKSVTFTPELPQAGTYEVRLAHCYNVRRATNTPVTIHHADGETVVRINQQEEPPHARLWRSLGTFRFTAGRDGWVRISNDSTGEKYVIADAVQFLPVNPPSKATRRTAGSRQTFGSFCLQNQYVAEPEDVVVLKVPETARRGTTTHDAAGGRRPPYI